MFSTVLVANRGVIACRIIRTLKKMGLRSVAVYSEADAHAAHVMMADEAVCIGPAAAAQSYLDSDRILAAAQQTGAGAIHPGYGFLSENAGFVQACDAAGIAFIGPQAEHMQAFGLKHTARDLAAQHQVPLLPGSGLLGDSKAAREEAERIGYPVMLKSTAGGGGIGMRLIRSASEMDDAFAAVDRLARANFKDAGIFVEKFIEHARHIEVQIFGDGHGRVVALGERDCSTQRRNQKVIEETPAPHLPEATRSALIDAAIRLGKAVNYRSAGTVEYVLDADTDAFYFLEVNTRLQVEHGVTEEVSGVDLVEWMVKLALLGDAAADPTHFAMSVPRLQGASIQVRLYAEDPLRQFQPCAGLLTEVSFPPQVRVETWVSRGAEVSPHYDPMIAKLIVTAATREEAVARLAKALADTRLAGIETNLDYLRTIVASDAFTAGHMITRSLVDIAYHSHAVEVLEAGVQTSIQDWPGRLGVWNVGVPPSGPMDDVAHRIANQLLGNASDAATLECTVSGPSLRFHGDTVIALGGADMQASLDGEPLALWTAIPVKAGATLSLGSIVGGGLRCYLAIQGGFDVPLYLNSRATFTLGQFGGHAGRCLRVGDMLHVGKPHQTLPPAGADKPSETVPSYPKHWHIGVMYGPHGAPDFFTAGDIDRFFATDWQVHYNSSRTGVRLIGPKPEWARVDGGEAGLHPSNIHDNAYAIGAIDFTGDMPVILGPDGPSLGGFVCPAVVVRAERWKLGQLKPGDTLQFYPVDYAQALALQHAQTTAIQGAQGMNGLPNIFAALQLTAPTAPLPLTSPVLISRAEAADTPALHIRQAGDAYVLLEYGAMQLDIALRLRIHALMLALEAQNLPGIIDLTPGIRSLQVHFNPSLVPRNQLVDTLLAADQALGDTDSLVVPSRTVYLPLSWDDSSTRLAIDKYMQSVRPNAPWCPSNIEFIRRINGLASIDEVYRLVFSAQYLVMGLGDVYLGAPVATPLDPRHRLVTTKYNPARTWTPENAVGIGGAYLCVYGMEGPGGYQFVGRTLQMWNRWRDSRSGAMDFEVGKPWLLRFFDRIQFYPVSEEELQHIREDFPVGRFNLRSEAGQFSLRDYRQFLADHADDIALFRSQQQQAFAAEREHWQQTGQAEYLSDDSTTAPTRTDDLPEGAIAVTSSVPGSVWKVLVQPGDCVNAGDTVMIIESMKMEFAVVAKTNGTVLQVLCSEGNAVLAGQPVMVLSAD